jgi:hypothetical protein
MSQFKNVMEVLALLEKNNCKQCNEKTCMAFAASVFLGKRPLRECPFVAKDVLEQYGVQEKKQNIYQEDLERGVAQLKEKLQQLDLKERAEAIGAIWDNEKVTLKIMGKDFSMDKEGNIYTLIHVNSWVLVSSLSYVIQSKGLPVEEDWVPLRELPGGKDWYRLFGQQCEKPLKKLADSFPDLFEDLVKIFGGQEVRGHFDSDIGVVLHPLPLVPILICYWLPEDGMESKLGIFFDITAEDNLGIESLYLLGTGISNMFEKLALQHGFKQS